MARKVSWSYEPTAKLDTLSAETKKLEAIYKQKLVDLDELKKISFEKGVFRKTINSRLRGNGRSGSCDLVDNRFTMKYTLVDNRFTI